MKCLVLKSVDTQMKAMHDRKKEVASGVPNLSTNTTVPRWKDSLKVHMNEVFGSNGATLYYLTRESATVPATAPLTVLGANSFQSAEGSILRLIR